MPSFQPATELPSVFYPGLLEGDSPFPKKHTKILLPKIQSLTIIYIELCLFPSSQINFPIPPERPGGWIKKHYDRVMVSMSLYIGTCLSERPHKTWIEVITKDRGRDPQIQEVVCSREWSRWSVDTNFKGISLYCWTLTAVKCVCVSTQTSKDQHNICTRIK